MAMQLEFRPLGNKFNVSIFPNISSNEQNYLKRLEESLRRAIPSGFAVVSEPEIIERGDKRGIALTVVPKLGKSKKAKELLSRKFTQDTEV